MMIEARMGWNPSSPTNECRVALLAYLRVRLKQIDLIEEDSSARANEIGSHRRWISWLNGETIEVPA